VAADDLLDLGRREARSIWRKHPELQPNQDRR
jgi:hypothetical protein